MKINFYWVGAYVASLVLLLLCGSVGLFGFLRGTIAWFICWTTPLLGMGISAAYFFASPPGGSFGRRVATSAHGVCITVLFFTADFIAWAGKSNSGFETPYDLAVLLIIVLMVASFIFFQGPKWLHLLQPLNLILLAEAWFFGGLEITGNFL